jgi:hypothetical protein
MKQVFQDPRVREALKKVLAPVLPAIRRFKRSKEENLFIGRDPHLPLWPKLIAQDRRLWEKSLAKAKTGPKVLLGTGIASFYNSNILDSLLAVALTLRGADVHVLLCDQLLSGCFSAKYRKTPPESLLDGSFREICRSCDKRKVSFTDLGVPIHYYSEFLTPEDHREIARIAGSIRPEDVPNFKWKGWAVGEHAYAGCLRFYSTGNLQEQVKSDEVLRKYLEAALQTALVTDRITDRHPFTVSSFIHGIYIPHGVIGEVCRSKNVRVVAWNTAYRKRSFVFSHNDTYHHTLLEEPVSAWKDMLFTEDHDRQITDYLRTRWLGSQDWIYFHDTPDDSLETLVRETGIDPKKPIIGMLTNVMWDAQLHYRANAFPTMLDWIEKTVRYFAGRPDIQLLIRVHPAELRGLQPSRQFVVDEVK